MKKLFFFAVCFSLFTVANAQTDFAPEKGDFAVELGFGGDSFKFNENMLKARWFISNRNAVRLKLGFGIDNKSTKSTISDNPIDTKNTNVINEQKDIKDKKTDFSFMLGYEYHLYRKGRFDVYAGIEMGYSMEKYSGSETLVRTESMYDASNRISRTYTDNYSIDFVNQSCDGRNTSMNSFNTNFFAGFDVYVWKNLYLGAELGFSIKNGKSPNYYRKGNEKEVTTNYYYGTPNYHITTTDNTVFGEDADVITTSTSSTLPGFTPTSPTITNQANANNKTTNTNFKLYVEPAIRIGWKF